MRTTIYVDGYNLYFGCLKHTHHKWIDLKKLLFEQIVIPQNPHSTLTQIRFYTADIKTKVATRGQSARHSQDQYHNALKAHLQEQVEIIKGYYSLEKANPLIHQEPPNKNERVAIWNLEEKQTDVNIAIDGYRSLST